MTGQLQPAMLISLEPLLWARFEGDIFGEDPCLPTIVLETDCFPHILREQYQVREVLAACAGYFTFSNEDGEEVDVSTGIPIAVYTNNRSEIERTRQALDPEEISRLNELVDCLPVPAKAGFYEFIREQHGLVAQYMHKGYSRD